MSTQLFLDRLTAVPSPATMLPDTLTYVSFKPGELKLCLTNASGTLQYETLTASEAAIIVENELAQPGGILSRIAALEADTHTHPNKNVIDNFTDDADGNIFYNGTQLNKFILTQEDW